MKRFKIRCPDCDIEYYDCSTDNSMESECVECGRWNSSDNEISDNEHKEYLYYSDEKDEFLVWWQLTDMKMKVCDYTRFIYRYYYVGEI